jgi:penicillin G amidase
VASPFHNLKIRRDQNGLRHVEARTESDLYLGQGYAHGADRGLQMLLMRLIGQGRISEVLEASEEALRVDRFFRRANWSNHTQAQITSLSVEDRECLEAYCRGVNSAWARRVPWELKLRRYAPEPWEASDTVLLLRMIGYLTLAQSQGEMERLFVEMAQAGVSKEKLIELFPGLLDGLDWEALQEVKLGERMVPAELWRLAVPRMMASNNWVVAGRKTASGKPILANDVHLEGNRLPAVWYEMVLCQNGRYALGGSLPGVPGILSGRNNDLAWGVTYAFVDAEDSWIEKCRDGKCYRQEQNAWVDFRRRVEVIKRRKQEAVETVFYENEHGVLEGNPAEAGSYLATRWAPAESGSGALRASFQLWRTRTVPEAMTVLSRVETGWNYLLADQEGNIGYQMTGLVPNRRPGCHGFVPLPGWDPKNDWRGFLNPEHLPRVLNPPEGFFATANDDLNGYGIAAPINMPMGPYRADRVRERLGARDGWQVRDMFGLQFDVYSRQAEAFMNILRPCLPDTPQGQLLAQWDLKYDAASRGAFLFERVYEELYRLVFGRAGWGEAAVDWLRKEGSVFVDFYANFDRVLLAETSAWFGDRSREELYREAAAKALELEPKTWGESRQFTMTNLFFGGKLPRFLGFDRGPFAAVGNRATLHQGQLYTDHGRQTSFLPSFRIVTDLGRDEIHSNLAGGPSDRRFSKWYASDVAGWLIGRYKRTGPGMNPEA